jgi:flavin reductase (DIM6/NTAB) family NADH-FMN oxidoreductase RutF
MSVSAEIDASDRRFAVAREALSRITHAVAVIAAADGPERACGTGTAMYVSFSPPMLAIAEHPGSRTCKLIQRTGSFSVSLLHSSQQDIAERAGHSAEGPDKFAALRIAPLERPGGAGAPGVANSIAVLWCDVRETRPTGDHILFVGEIVEHRVDPAKVDALLRFRRRYAHIGHVTSDEAPEGYPT